MKILRLFPHLLVAAGLFSSALCHGQTNNSAQPQTEQKFQLEQQPGPLLNKIGLTYSMGLNFKVDFHDLGGLQLTDPGPASGSAHNRNYDNGYNRVDSSGNQGGLTWNWGYTSPHSARPETLVLQSDSTPATAKSGTYQDGVQNGGEILYLHEFKREEHWRLGLESAFGYTFISIEDDQTLTYMVNRTSDTFNSGSVILPLPPYSGSFQGPGPLIGSTLTPAQRSTETVAGAAIISGERKSDTHLFTLRLGPYFEVPIYHKWSVTLDGGLLLAVADTRFKYRETVQITDPFYNINLVSAPRSGSGSETDFLVGGYAGANISFAVSEKVRLLAGARFQSAGEAVNKQDGKRSILNLGNSTIVSVGASYSF